MYPGILYGYCRNSSLNCSAGANAVPKDTFGGVNIRLCIFVAKKILYYFGLNLIICNCCCSMCIDVVNLNSPGNLLKKPDHICAGRVHLYNAVSIAGAFIANNFCINTGAPF